MRTTTRRTFLWMAGAAAIGAQTPQPNPAGKWQPAELIRPEELVARIRNKGASQPLIIHSGFMSTYRAGHIPGSIFGGPASNAAGLETLKRALSSVPKNRDIIVYCACCPWEACPNVRPAFELLQQLGYKQVKALIVPSNLEVDWAAKGYPLEKGA